VVRDAKRTKPAGHAVPRVGVLSLQGDFERHRVAIEAAGGAAVRVTLPAHLDGLDALVIPGGESTTMLRLLDSSGLRAPLERFVRAKPVLGTCAGVILLGRGAGRLPAPPFGVLDVEVERNAYGRQIDSFHETLDVPALGSKFPGVFIRAPRLGRIGRGVEVVARRNGAGDRRGEPVGVRQGRVVGLCFHPELTDDPRLYRWFLTEVAGLGGTRRGSQAARRAEGT
jgi:5'-phosphate synthase pdxT subunit